MLSLLNDSSVNFLQLRDNVLSYHRSNIQQCTARQQQYVRTRLNLLVTTVRITTLLIAIIATAHAQPEPQSGRILIAPMDYASYKIDVVEDGNVQQLSVSSETGSGSLYLEVGQGIINVGSISRHLFDLDDDIEVLYEDSHFDAHIYDATDRRSRVVGTGFGAGVIQKEDGAYLRVGTSDGGYEEKLPGNFPDFDHHKYYADLVATNSAPDTYIYNDQSGMVLIAPNEYAQWSIDENRNFAVLAKTGSIYINLDREGFFGNPATATLSRYMFDDDDEIEVYINVAAGNSIVYKQ